jgi:hypothetical protein
MKIIKPSNFGMVPPASGALRKQVLYNFAENSGFPQKIAQFR